MPQATTVTPLGRLARAGKRLYLIESRSFRMVLAAHAQRPPRRVERQLDGGATPEDTPSADAASRGLWPGKEPECKIRLIDFCYETLVTLAACGPFCPWTISNSTLSPSCRLL